jgi:hypothetical protein
MRIFTWGLHQSRSHWIVQDVACQGLYVVVTSKHTLEVALLPEAAVRSTCEGGAGSLFRKLRVALEISGSIGSLRQKVHVIGHEAVRNQFEALAHSGKSKLQQCRSDR